MGASVVWDSPGHAYLGENEIVEDSVGLNRNVAIWSTLNCPYNALHDIHRMNVDAKQGREALTSVDPILNQVRYDFIRDSPDMAATVFAVRSELNMRMVMPAVLPGEPGVPFRCMGRVEMSKNGMPHVHLVAVGAGNPCLAHDVEDDVNTCGDVVAVGAALEPIAADDDQVAAEEASEDCGDEDVEIRTMHGGAVVPPSPAPHPVPRMALALMGGGGSQEGGAGPDVDGVDGKQLLSKKEEEFWEFFGKRVSEWNPCFAEDGRVRYSFDRDVEAHNVEVDDGEDLVRSEPHRMNLRGILDEYFAQLDAGEPGDLSRLRRLVSSLVQTCGRHDRHGMQAPSRKDACARGKEPCMYCRFGFPRRGRFA
jgi:hypothetical protein